MKIGIDGNEANIEKRVGIGEYAFQVLRGLYLYKDVHQFTIFLKDIPRNDLPNETKNWHYEITLPKPFWTQLALPLKLYTGDKVDLIFSPTHYAPRFSPVPSVISVMDLSFLYYPELFNKSDLYKLTEWTRYSVLKARSVLTISEFSKKDIIKNYNLNEDKVQVTYPGYNKDIFHQNYPKEKIEEVKKRYSLTKYLIFVGTIQPRKNIQSLINAYSDLINEDPNYQLVLIGRKGWLYENIFKQINNIHYKNKIIYLDYIKDEKIIAKLYIGASCFVLPSLYEGFGLTVIEAMACGCPVVISDNSSLPEIVQNAAVYIQPTSVESIKTGISKIINEGQEDYRKKLIIAGLERVKHFSWDKCVQETLRIFEDIANKKL